MSWLRYVSRHGKGPDGLSVRNTIVSHRPRIIETVPNSVSLRLRPPSVISAISHPPRILLYIMNNIIIHFGSRVTVSAAHDLAIALAAQWYRKFTPWWVDGAEEEGLLPIDEADEPGEEVEEGSLEDEKDVDFAGEVDIFTDADLHDGGKLIISDGKLNLTIAWHRKRVKRE
ncbi:hypothetical protein F5887DRAFT_79422 [Amanita rubescens]|nr:hypothetical protein F5887DRAFT_79422 [Amanita rubescens]